MIDAEACIQEVIAYIDKAFDRKHGDSFWVDEQGEKHPADVGYGCDWWEICMKPELLRVFANCAQR